MIRLTQIRLLLLVLTLALILVVFNGASGKEATESHFLYLPVVNRPLPSVENIVEPLLIDGEEGRIYAAATVDGVRQTVVLSTDDGRYLDGYPYAGRLALDRSHNKLLIDQGGAGIVILDSTSGVWLGVIHLPHTSDPVADPQMDPDRGIAYVFRGHIVYMLDVQNLNIAEFKVLFVPMLVCGEPQGAANIDRSYYDIISNTLYLSFWTSWCTPHSMDTIQIYDAASWHKWSEYSTPSLYQAVPYAANLYGVSYDRGVGRYAYWVRSHTQTYYGEGGSNWITMAGNVVDWSRDLLYEAVWEYGSGAEVAKWIRVSYTDNRQIMTVIDYDRPPIQDARLAGHDPHTDQLYFLDQGALYVVPTLSILPVG